MNGLAMDNNKLREVRLSTGLSIKQASELSRTPYRTWQGWEYQEGPNARRAPGIAFAWLELYAKLKELDNTF